MALSQDNDYLCHTVVVVARWFKSLLLQPVQGSIEGLECHRHSIKRLQAIQDVGDMKVTILVYHLGIVLDHALQQGKYGFLNLGGVMLLLQCLLNFTTLILIGDGILLYCLSEEGKADVSVPLVPELMPGPGALLLQGMVPIVMALGGGRPI